MNRKKAKGHERLKRSHRRMVCAILAIVISIALTLVLFSSGVLDYAYAFTEIMSNMQSIRHSLDDEDPFTYEYYQVLSDFAEKNYYLIEVFDPDGNTIFSNPQGFLSFDGVSGNSGSLNGIGGLYESGKVVRVYDTFDEDMSIDLYEYTDDGNSSYYRYRVELKNGDILRMWLPLYQVERNAGTASVLLIAFAIIAGAVACVIILYSNLRIARPVAEMAEITEAMAKLDFTKKCDDYPQTDVQNLGKNINILSASLSETLDELQDKNEKLTEELEHSALIDESRKSFIANVSHELKTPIAIIQGYAEGLKLGINSDPESSGEYCDIILEETDKMNRIVMELLNLEKIESGSYEPTLERFDLSEMIASQLAAFSMMFNDNGIIVQNRIPDGLEVNSDERTVLLVLQNFLSNAVSNISGKKIVQLTVEERESVYRVSVYNSGEPIADDELDKIWYSFYKSSKKRKNEDFHFGLGLPIVHAIQKRLDKECGVVNEHGGVRFWFDVDKA